MKITKVCQIAPCADEQYTDPTRYFAQPLQLVVNVREPDIDYVVSLETSDHSRVVLKSGVMFITADMEAVAKIKKYLDKPLYRVTAPEHAKPVVSTYPGVRPYEQDDPFFGDR